MLWVRPAAVPKIFWFVPLDHHMDLHNDDRLSVLGFSNLFLFASYVGSSLSHPSIHSSNHVIFIEQPNWPFVPNIVLDAKDSLVDEDRCGTSILEEIALQDVRTFFSLNLSSFTPHYFKTSFYSNTDWHEYFECFMSLMGFGEIVSLNHDHEV